MKQKKHCNYLIFIFALPILMLFACAVPPPEKDNMSPCPPPANSISSPQPSLNYQLPASGTSTVFQQEQPTPPPVCKPPSENPTTLLGIFQDVDDPTKFWNFPTSRESAPYKSYTTLFQLSYKDWNNRIPEFNQIYICITGNTFTMYEHVQTSTGMPTQFSPPLLYNWRIEGNNLIAEGPNPGTSKVNTFRACQTGTFSSQ